MPSPMVAATPPTTVDSSADSAGKEEPKRRLILPYGSGGGVARAPVDAISPYSGERSIFEEANLGALENENYDDYSELDLGGTEIGSISDVRGRRPRLLIPYGDCMRRPMTDSTGDMRVSEVNSDRHPMFAKNVVSYRAMAMPQLMRLTRWIISQYPGDKRNLKLNACLEEGSEVIGEGGRKSNNVSSLLRLQKHFNRAHSVMRSSQDNSSLRMAVFVLVSILQVILLWYGTYHTYKWAKPRVSSEWEHEVLRTFVLADLVIGDLASIEKFALEYPSMPLPVVNDLNNLIPTLMEHVAELKKSLNDVGSARMLREMRIAASWGDRRSCLRFRAFIRDVVPMSHLCSAVRLHVDNVELVRSESVAQNAKSTRSTTHHREFTSSGQLTTGM